MCHALFLQQDEADSKTASPWKVSFFYHCSSVSTTCVLTLSCFLYFYTNCINCKDLTACQSWSDTVTLHDCSALGWCLILVCHFWNLLQSCPKRHFLWHGVNVTCPHGIWLDIEEMSKERGNSPILLLTLELKCLNHLQISCLIHHNSGWLVLL